MSEFSYKNVRILYNRSNNDFLHILIRYSRHFIRRLLESFKRLIRKMGISYNNIRKIEMLKVRMISYIYLEDIQCFLQDKNLII